MGVGRKTARKRAVGTREHIIAYLTEVNELFDANGMASTQLAAAVGYPGSSVAFAQLLSGMERSGLIEREVRGKRTYRIGLGPARAGGVSRGAGVPAGSAAAGVPGSSGSSGSSGIGGMLGVSGVSGTGGVSGSSGVSGVSGVPMVSGVPRVSGVPDPGGAGDFDYDELARRLLVQVVRRLAAAEPDASHPDPSALQETVTGLEYELATAWTKHGKLAEENVRLREQLRAAQRSLALAAERVRRLPVSTDLDSSEVVLLQRLLASGSSDDPDGTGREAEDARSVLS